MKAVRVHKMIEKDGEIKVTGLPCKKGQSVELVVLIEPAPPPSRPPLTARRLLNSGLVGMWKDRDDIADSAAYDRQLREEAQRRQVRQ